MKNARNTVSLAFFIGLRPLLKTKENTCLGQTNDSRKTSKLISYGDYLTNIGLYV